MIAFLSRLRAAFFAAVVFSSVPALAAEEVVVVDVQGDLDPNAVREAIAAELGTPVVAPDDPRARDAKRILEARADGEEHQLSVSLRTTSAPVTRTVRLPDDRAAWPKTVRFLAGNLARDEAGALLAELRPPAKQAPEPERARPPEIPDVFDEEVRQLHRYLDVRAENERHDRRQFTTIALSAGLAAIAGGTTVYLLGKNDPTSYNAEMGSSLIGFGVGFTLVGVLVGTGSGAHEQLRARARSVNDREELARFEREWKELADETRVGAKRLAVAGGLLGLAAIGAGTAVAIAVDDPRGIGTGVGLASTGALLGMVSIVSYGSRTEVERSLSEYRALTYRSPRPVASRPAFGVVPARGGASVGISFAF